MTKQAMFSAISLCSYISCASCKCPHWCAGMRSGTATLRCMCPHASVWLRATLSLLASAGTPSRLCMLLQQRMRLCSLQVLALLVVHLKAMLFLCKVTKYMRSLGVQGSPGLCSCSADLVMCFNVTWHQPNLLLMFTSCSCCSTSC